MTSTRDLVQDERDQFAFHDDIVYLAQTKRGLTRDTVEEISRFKDEPDWMLQYRLRAYEHFLKRKMPTWGGRARRHRPRQDRLLPQAVRARGEVVGRRPREDQGDVREAGHPRGGAQVPRRRRRPVRLRGGLPLRARGAEQDRRRLHGHRPGAQGVPGDLPQVLRHGRPGRGQQVRRAQRRGLVGRLVRLRPQGRRGPAPAPGLLPHQRREHGPVRADADRRGRGRQGPLHRGLHGPDLRHGLAPCGGRRGRRPGGLQGPLHDHPELVERRLQPRHQAGPRLREQHRRVGRREHRLPADHEVPRDLPRGEGATRRGHLGGGRRPGPAPGHRRQGRPPGAEHHVPDRVQVRVQGRRAGHVPRPAQGGARARRASPPASAATP